MKYSISLSELQEASTPEEVLDYKNKHSRIKKRRSAANTVRNARKQKKNKWKYGS